MSNTNEMVREVHFDASIDKVWNFLIDPEQTKQYMFGCAVQSTWEIGSSVLWVGQSEDGTPLTYVKGEVLEFVPKEKLVITMFDPNLGLADTPSNYATLTYKLSTTDQGTALHIVQAGFDTVENGPQRLQDTIKGWDMVIPLMQKMLLANG